MKPFWHSNLNVLGRYSFAASVPRDGLRPLLDLYEGDDGSDDRCICPIFIRATQGRARIPSHKGYLVTVLEHGRDHGDAAEGYHHVVRFDLGTRVHWPSVRFCPRWRDGYARCPSPTTTSGPARHGSVVTTS